MSHLPIPFSIYNDEIENLQIHSDPVIPVVPVIPDPIPTPVKDVDTNKPYGQSKLLSDTVNRTYADYWSAVNKDNWKNLYLTLEFLYELYLNDDEFYTRFVWKPQSETKVTPYYSLHMTSPERKSTMAIKQIKITSATTNGLTSYDSNSKDGKPAKAIEIDLNTAYSNSMLVTSKLKNNEVELYVNGKGFTQVAHKDMLQWFGTEFKQMMLVVAATGVGANRVEYRLWNPVKNSVVSYIGTNTNMKSDSRIQASPNQIHYDEHVSKSSGFFVKMADYRPGKARVAGPGLSNQACAEVIYRCSEPPNPVITSCFCDSAIVKLFHASLHNIYAINLSVCPQISAVNSVIAMAYLCDGVAVLDVSRAQNRNSALSVVSNTEASF